MVFFFFCFGFGFYFVLGSITGVFVVAGCSLCFYNSANFEDTIFLDSNMYQSLLSFLYSDSSIFQKVKYNSKCGSKVLNTTMTINRY